MKIRLVKAVHGKKKIKPDPAFEIKSAKNLKKKNSPELFAEWQARCAFGEGVLENKMRRILWRALAKRFGNGIHIGSGAGFKHLETFELGDGVFIGAQAYLQGRYDGRCKIGKGTWIGPQAYLDARDLIIGEYVGWGPGAKVLGSEHTGKPINVPIIQTDLEIKPVVIEDWADIGTNSVILPGIRIGKGSIIGAGAVVTTDVPAYAIYAGVPARFLRWREGYIPSRKTK